MIHVHATIDIQASPAEVFGLLCDPERKTRLHPEVEVLHAAALTPGPITSGSRIFYRLRTATGVREFHCEISAFEPEHRIEWISDTQPLFRVRQVIEPTATGCRLRHDEWLEGAAPAPAPVNSKWSLAAISETFQHAAGLAMTFRSPEDEQHEALQRSLGLWLENIRGSLEMSRTNHGDDLHALTTIAF